MPEKKKPVQKKPVKAAVKKTEQPRKKPAMELFFIVYSNPIDEEVIEILGKYKTGYTKFNGVQGEGRKEPHLGTNIWPGINNCIMVVSDSATRGLIAEEIMEFKAKFAGIGVSVFVTDLKESL